MQCFFCLNLYYASSKFGGAGQTTTITFGADGIYCMPRGVGGEGSGGWGLDNSVIGNSYYLSG